MSRSFSFNKYHFMKKWLDSSNYMNFHIDHYIFAVHTSDNDQDWKTISS